MRAQTSLRSRPWCPTKAQPQSTRVLPTSSEASELRILVGPTRASSFRRLNPLLTSVDFLDVDSDCEVRRRWDHTRQDRGPMRVDLTGRFSRNRRADAGNKDRSYARSLTSKCRGIIKIRGRGSSLHRHAASNWTGQVNTNRYHQPAYVISSTATLTAVCIVRSKKTTPLHEKLTIKTHESSQSAQQPQSAAPPAIGCGPATTLRRGNMNHPTQKPLSAPAIGTQVHPTKRALLCGAEGSKSKYMGTVKQPKCA
jgi:hypothetical protein